MLYGMTMLRRAGEMPTGNMQHAPCTMHMESIVKQEWAGIGTLSFVSFGSLGTYFLILCLSGLR